MKVFKTNWIAVVLLSLVIGIRTGEAQPPAANSSVDAIMKPECCFCHEQPQLVEGSFPQKYIYQCDSVDWNGKCEDNNTFTCAVFKDKEGKDKTHCRLKSEPNKWPNHSIPTDKCGSQHVTIIPTTPQGSQDPRLNYTAANQCIASADKVYREGNGPVVCLYMYGACNTQTAGMMHYACQSIRNYSKEREQNRNIPAITVTLINGQLFSSKNPCTTNLKNDNETVFRITVQRGGKINVLDPELECDEEGNECKPGKHIKFEDLCREANSQAKPGASPPGKDTTTPPASPNVAPPGGAAADGRIKVVVWGQNNCGACGVLRASLGAAANGQYLYLTNPVHRDWAAQNGYPQIDPNKNIPQTYILENGAFVGPLIGNNQGIVNRIKNALGIR